MKWAKTFVKPKIYHDNKISQKFAHFCLIFAFRENEKKNVFVSTLSRSRMHENYAGTRHWSVPSTTVHQVQYVLKAEGKGMYA
jgi:hypothetical protein